MSKLDQIQKALFEIKYAEDFAKFLASIGISGNHPEYGGLMCDFMFGGCDPNKIADAIHDEVCLITDFGPAESDYQPGPDFEADFQS